MRRQQVERFDDDDANPTQALLGNLLGSITPSNKGNAYRIATYLPDEQQQREREYLEDEEEGLHDPSYKCLFCVYGGEGAPAQTLSDALRKIYELQGVYEGKIPDEDLDDLISDQFNARIYDKLAKNNQEIVSNLCRMTRAKSRHHRTKCDQNNPLRILWKEVKDVSMDRDFLRQNAIYTRLPEDDKDDTSKLKMCHSSYNMYLRAGKHIQETIKIMEQVKHLRSNNGPLTKKQKTGPAKTFTDL